MKEMIPSEVCKLLNISKPTLYKWSKAKPGKKPILSCKMWRHGNLVIRIYSASDVYALAKKLPKERGPGFSIKRFMK